MLRSEIITERRRKEFRGYAPQGYYYLLALGDVVFSILKGKKGLLLAEKLANFRVVHYSLGFFISASLRRSQF